MNVLLEKLRNFCNFPEVFTLNNFSKDFPQQFPPLEIFFPSENLSEFRDISRIFGRNYLKRIKVGPARQKSSSNWFITF